MEILELKTENHFNTYLFAPTIENFQESKQQISGFSVNEIATQKKYPVDAQNLLFFKSTKNTITAKAPGYFTGINQDNLTTEALSYFNLDKLSGFEIDNIRPARGCGAIIINCVLKNKTKKPFLILHIDTSQTNSNKWDDFFAFYEKTYFNQIQAFFNQKIIKRCNRYDA